MAARHGGTRSIVFTPPPASTAAADNTVGCLHTEPEDMVLLFGLMLEDVRIMQDLLGALPFAGANYSGNLRVVRGACERLRIRCTRLIGD